MDYQTYRKLILSDLYRMTGTISWYALCRQVLIGGGGLSVCILDAILPFYKGARTHCSDTLLYHYKGDASPCDLQVWYIYTT